MKIYNELEELGLFEWLDKDHNLTDKRDVTPEYLENLPINDIHRTVINACAFRFFRKKYKLEGLILPQTQGVVICGEPIYFIAIISYRNELMKELFNSTNQKDLLHYNPREEAELACIKKLIEISKSGSLKA